MNNEKFSESQSSFSEFLFAACDGGFGARSMKSHKVAV